MSIQLVIASIPKKKEIYFKYHFIKQNLYSFFPLFLFSAYY